MLEWGASNIGTADCSGIVESDPAIGHFQTVVMSSPGEIGVRQDDVVDSIDLPRPQKRSDDPRADIRTADRPRIVKNNPAIGHFQAIHNVQHGPGSLTRAWSQTTFNLPWLLLSFSARAGDESIRAHRNCVVNPPSWLPRIPGLALSGLCLFLRSGRVNNTQSPCWFWTSGGDPLTLGRERRRLNQDVAGQLLPLVTGGTSQNREVRPTMTEIHLCRQCGADLPGDTPDGLCPACRPAGVGTALDPGITSALPGQTTPVVPADLARHFPTLEILGLLGQGGMGTVYKARQLRLDRLVALKILTVGPDTAAAFADRFLREARALARLAHPAIVTIHDFGEAGELYYFVMEHVEGGSLRRLVRPGRLDQAQALNLVSQMCDALQYAHEEGIVHRDVKPENILLDRRGRVKVADFGLARLLGPTPADFTLTRSRMAMGTPHYMAPEQWEEAHTVDHRADIYSLGVVFYEMLTGELPLGRFALPSQKAPLDTRLDEVVLRALEKDLDRRYQQVADLRADVERVAVGRPAPIVLLPPLSGPDKPGPVAPSLGEIAPFAAAPAEAGSATELAGALSGPTTPPEPALEAVRREVSGPAIGLLVAGLLSLVQPLLLLFFLNAPVASFLTLSVLTVVATGFGAVTILAARKMRLLEAPELVFIGSILALAPLGPGWALGLPMGIWALLVLRKPEVGAAFAAPKPAPAASFRWRRLLPGTITAWALIICFLGVVLGFTPWATFETRKFVAKGPEQLVTNRVLGVFAWPGLLATVLFLTLGGGLLLARFTWPLAVRRLSGVLAFLRVLMSLAGLFLILLMLLSLAAVGPLDGSNVTLQIAALLAIVGLGLMASLFLPRAFWQPAVLLVTGLELLGLVGFWMLQADEIQVYAVFRERRSASTDPWLWKNGAVELTAFPFLALACAAGLVLLGGLQFPRSSAAFRAGSSSTSRGGSSAT
jgi:hypothetical protein